MGMDNIIMEQARKTDGKKIGIWELRMPNDTRSTVDIYMRRKDGCVYQFYVNMTLDTHGIDAHLVADTPTELAELLNVAVAKDIKKTWKKMLQIYSDSWANTRISPEEPGEHELQVKWHVVWTKGVGKKMVYIYDGEMFPRTVSYCSELGEKSRDGVFIPWTQQREDVLRGLGQAIHEAQTKLSKLVDDGGIQTALDQASTGLKMLMPPLQKDG